MRAFLFSAINLPFSMVRYFKNRTHSKKTDDKNSDTEELLLVPTEEKQKFELSTPQALKQYSEFIFSSENKSSIACASLLTVAITVFSILAPYYFGLIIESFSKNKDNEAKLDEASAVAIQTIFQLVFLNSIAPLLSNLRNQLLIHVDAHNRQKLITRTVKHSLENVSFESHRAVEDSEKMFLVNKAFSVSSAGTPLLTQVTPKFLELFIAGATLSVNYGASMGLSVFAMSVVFTVYCKATTKKIIDANETMNDCGKIGWEKLLYAMTQYETIHHFGKSKEIVDSVDQVTRDAERAEIQVAKTPLKIALGHMAIANFGMLAILASEANNFSLASLVTVFGYLNQLANSLPAAGHAMNDVFAKLPDLKLVFSELAKPSEIVDSGHQVLNIDRGPAIRVENLVLSHSNKPIFSGLSLDIESGQTVALVAASGGGKSTLFKLLFRYSNPNSGSIFINGKEISTITLDSLRDHIGVIGQHPHLLMSSVRENIKFGAKNKDDMTDEKIAALAEKLNLYKFICQLSKEKECTPETFKKGLDMSVRGLSGGEQKRISILQGFAKEVPIRLLDEITESLDAAAAASVMEGIANITHSEKTTTVIVTHRLTEIVNADKIFVFENGAVAASGTHQQLLTQNDLYRHLWEKQNEEPALQAMGLFKLPHQVPEEVQHQNRGQLNL